MGTISRQYTFVAGAVPTADNWNADWSQMLTLVNGQLDKGNVDSSSSDGICTLDENQTITGVKTFTTAQVFNNGITINEGSNDSDTRIETNNMANAVVIDAGLDCISFGAAAVDDSFVQIAKGATTSSATQNTYHLNVAPGGATTIPSGTTAYAGSVNINEPNLTATGTITNAFSLRVAGAPTEGSTTNYALWIDSGATQLDGTLTVGVDDTGADVKFFGASAGAYLLYDESADTLDVRGATAAGAGKLKLTTGELTVVDGDILGRIDFQAPLEASGTDAVLVGASIWAEADDTFGTALNDTDLVFAVAESETAAERMRLAWDGTTTQLYFAQVCNIESAGDITLTAASSGDVNIPADIGLTFGDDGEKIEGDGTDLTIASSNLINLTATTDIQIPANVGLLFGTGEKIEGDSTNLTVTSGGLITLTATGNTVVTNNAVVSGTLASGALTVTGAASATGNIHMATNNTFLTGKLTGGATKNLIGWDNGNAMRLGHIDMGTVKQEYASSSSATGVRVMWNKSRGTDGSQTIVADGDDIVTLEGYGYNGSGYDPVAYIKFEVDGTPGSSSDMPGRLTFLTTPNGSASVAERMRIDNAGAVHIGDTANSYMTQGLTINQGTNDNEIMSLKSSTDVAHDFTDTTEADTYGVFRKHSASFGGLHIMGFAEGNQAGLGLHGCSETADNTHTASGTGCVRVYASDDGGSDAIADLSGGENIISIHKGDDRGGDGLAVFFIDAAGNYWFDGAAQTAFDSYDDAELVRAVSVATSPADVIRSRWDEAVKYNEQDLIDADILGGPVTGTDGEPRGMVNGAQLQRLHNGAIWQLHTQLMETLERLASAENKLAQLTA